MLKFIETQLLSDEEKQEILALWNNEYPANLAHNSMEDFEKYLKELVQVNHVLVKDESLHVKGWYVDFIRDKARWFAMILDSSIQGSGIGSKLLNLAKRKNSKLYGWAIDKDDFKKNNGDRYRSPIHFYVKNSFLIDNHTRLDTEKISAVMIKWSEK